MLFLPIVERELRVAARSSRTYWSRVTAGTGALAMALYLIWMARYALGGAAAGLFILKATAYMAWALCVFGGVNRTCDSLSSEKRSETLGLLFLTHLKGYDVIGGKLLAAGLSAVFLLAGLVPILSIPVMLGGVTGTDMVRIPISLFNALFLALSTGLLASALLRNQKAAAALAGGVMAFLAVVLPAAAQITDRQMHQPGLAWLLRMPSPLCAQEMAFSSAFGLSTNDFWLSIALQLSLGLAALGGACLIIPHTWKTGAVPVALWREKFNRWAQGRSEDRLRRRTRLLAQNPFFWISCRDRFAPVWPFVFAFIILGATLGCIVHYDIPQPPACGLLLAAIAVNDLVTRLRVASLGAARFAEDRQSGALEMILSTPMTVGEMISGQWRAIRHTCLPVFCALFLLYTCVASIFLYAMEPSLEGCAVMAAFAVLSIGDFITMSYVAMWQGMRVRDPRQAAGAALVRVVIVPWFLWFACLPAIQGIPMFKGFFESNQPFSYMTGAMTLWSLSSLFALRNARSNLKRYFREAATDRYLFERRFDWLRSFRRPKSAAAPAGTFQHA